MPLDRIIQRVAKFAGAAGIVYAIGFIIHASHFRMLGVPIPVLDPVLLIGMTVEFLIDTVRIMLAGLKDWIYFIVLAAIIVLWRFRGVLVPRGILAKVQPTPAQGDKKTDRSIVESFLLVTAVLIMLLWIGAFDVPVMYMRDFLILPGGATYDGPTITFGKQIFEDLLAGKSESLKFLYQAHVYVIILGMVIVRLKSPVKRNTKQSKKPRLSFSAFVKDWPSYIIKLAMGVLVIHVFLLPIAYGVTAREPLFPNVKVIIDPEKVEIDDIYGLNRYFKTGQNFYILYKDASHTYLYDVKTRAVTMLRSESVYSVEFVPTSKRPVSILQHISRGETE